MLDREAETETEEYSLRRQGGVQKRGSSYRCRAPCSDEATSVLNPPLSQFSRIYARGGEEYIEASLLGTIQYHKSMPFRA